MQALQPGHVLAVNPLVTQALQAALWSANNGYSTAAPTTNLHPQQPAPPGAPPAPHTHPFTLSAGNLHYAATFPPSGHPSDMYAPPQHVLPTKPAPRWPPHFESNGGQYVYQATSGYFLNAATEFFYDPKSHLYYSVRDGVYFNYDASVQPPFKLFVPPEPSSTPSAVPATRGSDAPNNHNTVPTVSSTATAAVTGQAAQQGKVKVGLSAGSGLPGSKSAGAVGFGGFGLSGAKKVKIDLAKWSSLQQDEEEAPAPTKEGNSSNGAAGNTKEVVHPVAEIVISESKPSAPSAQLHRDKQDTSSATCAELETAKATEAANVPHPPPAAPTLTPAPAPVISIPPVCLLCQRQFASFEMLQRHEKESKLHADNMKKLTLQ